jgi:hypothetical protein
MRSVRLVTPVTIGLLALALLVVGCATTRQARSVKERGFLGDYSQLVKGKGDQAGLVYINESASFSNYDAVMIDSVTLWKSKATSKVSAKDQQRLTDSLYKALHEQLSADYRMADRPGPGVLRIRAAITEAVGANVVGNAVTSIVPQLRVLTTVGGLAADSAMMAGSAAIEAEVTDSLSGERLAAAVDKRLGTKTLRGAFGKWTNVDNAFEYWAERLRTRLAELRAS